MHKAGFVNIVGNPNVGKSTLMNVLVGERISIATFKAQTTRHRIMGIYNTDEMQIVFSDTPGVLKPNYKLQESMLNFSTSALTDADILLYVTDVDTKSAAPARTAMTATARPPASACDLHPLSLFPSGSGDGSGSVSPASRAASLSCAAASSF